MISRIEATEEATMNYELIHATFPLAQCKIMSIRSHLDRHPKLGLDDIVSRAVSTLTANSSNSSIVINLLLWGCESWTLTAGKRNNLNVLSNNWVREMSRMTKWDL